MCLIGVLNFEEIDVGKDNFLAQSCYCESVCR